MTFLALVKTLGITPRPAHTKCLGFFGAFHGWKPSRHSSAGLSTGSASGAGHRVDAISHQPGALLLHATTMCPSSAEFLRGDPSAEHLCHRDIGCGVQAVSAA